MAAIINLRAPAGTVQNALNLTDDQFGNLKVSNSWNEASIVKLTLV